jgi:hypothetical protein
MPSTIPDTVLTLLPDYLLSVHDLLSLSITSKNSRALVLDNVTSAGLFRLCYLSNGTIWSRREADGWYLLSAIAKGISLWLREEGLLLDSDADPRGGECAMARSGDDDVHMEENAQDNGQPDFRTMSRRQQFKAACVFGPEGLLRLCLYYDSIPILAGWSWDSIHTMVDRWYKVANPLTDLIDKSTGKQWYDHYNEGIIVDPPTETIFSEPDMHVLQIITYGELFGRGLEDWYMWNDRQDKDNVSHQEGNQHTSSSAHPALTPDQAWFRERSMDVGLRMEFVKYCLSDYCVSGAYHEQRLMARDTEWASDNLRIWDDRPAEYPSSPKAVYIQSFDDNLRADSDNLERPNAGMPSLDPWVNELIAIVSEFGPYAHDAEGYLNLGRRENCAVLSTLLRSPYLWNMIAKSVRQELVGPTEFGPSLVMYTTPMRTPRWKQLLWEDAMWCTGWGGAELMAEAWEIHEENDKARMLEEMRGAHLDPRIAATPTAEMEETKRKLLVIYQCMEDMVERPESIAIRRS